MPTGYVMLLEKHRFLKGNTALFSFASLDREHSESMDKDELGYFSAINEVTLSNLINDSFSNPFSKQYKKSVILTGSRPIIV